MSSKGKKPLAFTMSVSCLLLATLSATGMGFKKFHLLFAITDLHTHGRHDLVSTRGDEKGIVFSFPWNFDGCHLFISQIHQPFIELTYTAGTVLDTQVMAVTKTKHLAFLLM